MTTLPTAILLLFLALFPGGKRDVVSEVNSEGSCYSLSESPAPDEAVDHTFGRDICITAAHGYSFTGGGNSNSVSVRTTNSGHRHSPKTKSTVRIVKSGKVIDNNNLHPFLTPSFMVLSGTRVFGRYLLSIRRLRL